MDDPSGSLLAFLIFFTFSFSLLCCLARSAHANFSIVRLEELLTTEKAKEKLRGYLERNNELLTATSIAETLSDVFYLLFIFLCFLQDGNIDLQSALFPLIVCLTLLIIFAKALPTSFGETHPEWVMKWAFSFMQLCYWLLAWLLWPLAILTNFVNNLVIIPSKSTPAAIGREILEVVSKGEKEGIFYRNERNMIQAIIRLKKVEVKEIMTPRTDCVLVHVDEDIHRVLALSEGYSRIPVYRESRDDIIGVFYIKDLLDHWGDTKRDDLTLRQLIRPPYLIPETKPVSRLLKEFQEQKLHIAIVLDEYGGTAGIVTIEDIIEEIVGEIDDEYDSEIYEPILQVGENSWEIDARVHVAELNEKWGLNLPVSEEYDTLGGFLFSLIEHIPIKGDSHCYEDLKFTVLDASDRCINRIRIDHITGEENT